MIKFRDLDLGIREPMEVLILAVTERETKNGKPYVVFQVTDGEKTVDVKKWDCRSVEYEAAVQRVLSMNIKASMYGSEITYDTDKAVASYTHPATDFIQKVPEDITAMLSDVKTRIGTVKDAALREMMQAVLADYKEKLSYWAAAVSVHHALYGGLLYHMYRMGKNADTQCTIYPDLNRDLLLCGAYLHDIGKLMELETSPLGAVEYTTDGNLLGHAYLGMELVEIYGQKHQVDPQIILQLKHMIASHHGNLEWGAVTTPKTIEAQMLHFLDMIDSKMYVYEQETEDLQPGESSEYIRSMGSLIYKF